MKYTLSLAFALTFLGQAMAQKDIVGSGLEVDPYHYTIAKNEKYTHAAVACAHPLASQVGAAILKKGGNAFDAIVAVQFALAVVYPGAGNIGGGGFMTARTASGKNIALDYREKAPGKASRDMYLDAKGNANTDLSQNGHLAVGVPGTVAGIFKTLPYTKLPFAELIQPAITLAEKGFVLTPSEARGLNAAKADFQKYNAYKIAFVKDSGTWNAGDTLFQPDLANTLRRILENKQAGFYDGKTAKLLVATIKKGNGIISLADLKNYDAKERQPLLFNYRGYDIVSFPPPSSGGIILGQMFKMIEPFPVGNMGFQTVQSAHLMIEAERRAYADRAKYMGDPDFWKVPDSVLLSNVYLMQRMSSFDPDSASKSENIGPGWIKTSEETTHISIADKEGNLVSVTTTLNNHFGSKVVVEGAGFILNDEMDDFSVKPGTPNMYGAVGGEANAIAPNKRMLSSMCPSLVLKGNQPFMVVGTPGGTTIPTSVFQTIVNVIDFKMNIASAINVPKFHQQWLPDVVYVENDFPEDVSLGLQKMGYKIEKRGNIGRVEAIRFENGQLDVAADKRGDDAVAGY